MRERGEAEEQRGSGGGRERRRREGRGREEGARGGVFHPRERNSEIYRTRGRAGAGAAGRPPARSSWRPFRPWDALGPGAPPNWPLLAALRNAAVAAARARPGVPEGDLAAALAPPLGAAAARELLDALVACGQLCRTEFAPGGGAPPWVARPPAGAGGVRCYQAPA